MVDLLGVLCKQTGSIGRFRASETTISPSCNRDEVVGGALWAVTKGEAKLGRVEAAFGPHHGARGKSYPVSQPPLSASDEHTVRCVGI